jgi:uncharacterized membrane protein YphA (DoxX/SURF4 family)
LIFFLEIVGAICLILGLFTRFFAAAIAIELAVITFHVSWRNVLSFSNPDGGWSFPSCGALLSSRSLCAVGGRIR